MKVTRDTARMQQDARWRCKVHGRQQVRDSTMGKGISVASGDPQQSLETPKEKGEQGKRKQGREESKREGTWKDMSGMVDTRDEERGIHNDRL